MKNNEIISYFNALKNYNRFYTYQIKDVVYFFDQHASEVFSLSGDIAELFFIDNQEELDKRLISLSCEKLEDINAFLKEIVEYPDREIPSKKVKNRINILKLNISEECNLDCAYCFRNKNQIPAIADKNIILQAIDQMVNDFGLNAENYTICYNLSGEPLLQMDLLKEVWNYVLKTKKKRKKNFDLFILTNGTILKPETIKDLKKVKRNKKISLSLDGPKEVHDKQRVYTDGKGTYDDIVKNIKMLKKKGYELCAEGVVTKLFPKPLDIVMHYHELGFSDVLLKPVRSGTKYSFDLESIEDLKKGYREYFNFLKEELLSGNYAILHFFAKDYAIRFFTQILAKHKTERNCMWGVNSVSMDYKGDFFPCDSIMGFSEYKVGSVNEGVDWKKYHKNLSVNKRGECKSCWAKNICGGTCHVNGIYNGNDPLKIDSVECELKKLLIIESLYLLFELMQEGRRIDLIEQILLKDHIEIYHTY